MMGNYTRTELELAASEMPLWTEDQLDRFAAYLIDRCPTWMADAIDYAMLTGGSE